MSGIGLVGCGNWGRHVLRDLRALGCDVSVAARSDESRRRATEGGAATIVDSIEELPPVDGVVVVTPTTLHAEAVEKLLERSIPVFVEKPLTCDPASAQRLAGDAGDRVFVMDKWRYHPGVEAIAEIASNGELGDVVGLRTTRVGWGSPHGDIDAVWHLAPHDLAIAAEILGAVPAPRAAAAEYAGDAVVGMVGLLGETPWLAFEVSHRRAERRREVRLVCRRGMAVLPDSYSEHVEVIPTGDDGSSEPKTQRRPISNELPLLRELRAFLEHVDGGPPPRSSAAEGLVVVEAIAELRRLAGLKPTGPG